LVLEDSAHIKLEGSIHIELARSKPVRPIVNGFLCSLQELLPFILLNILILVKDLLSPGSEV